MSSNPNNSCYISPILSSLETSYVTTTYRQFIDTLGTTVTWNSQVTSATNTYAFPNISYTSQTIQALVNNITEAEYSYIEVGFLPVHYASVWEYTVTPQVGDRMTWKGIDWECRNSYPVVLGSTTAYYRCIVRRILVSGSLKAGGP